MPLREPWTTSARLTLHPWTDADRSRLAELAVRPEVVRHVGDGRPWSPELVSAKHEAALAHWRRHDFGWLTAYAGHLVERLVGIVALTRRSAAESGIDRPAVELGYWTVPEEWGRGYATESAAAAVREVFARDLADDLIARYHPENLASAHVLDAVGFRTHADGLAVLERP